MRTIFTIAKREFKAYFFSPIAYVYLITFLVITNWLFFRNFFLMGQADMRVFFMLMPWIYLFFVPAVSMSKWSEEKKMGTMELLLTLPVRDSQVVVGKFLAALALLVIALVLTLSIPLTVSMMGSLDKGPLIGGYIGLIFIGAAYLSIGLFISALTENQIIAFILGVVACFIFFILGEQIFTTSIPDFLVGIFQYLGLGNHFMSIGRGVLDSKDVVYYLSVIGFFLWLNLKAVEIRSWKGRSKKDLFALALSVVIVLSVVNFLSSRHFFRIDLTEKGEYTLSTSTKNILKNLDDVVNINVYFSEDLPPAITMARRDVDDVLSEYRSYAGQKIKVQYIDPQESLEIETKVQMMGIPPVQINVIQQDKQELAKIYLGMTIAHQDRKEVIPVVQRTGTLEYEITSAILKVTKKDMPVIKWWAAGEGANYNAIKGLLKHRYDIKNVSAEDINLSPSTDALLVLALGKDLTEAEIFAVDQYLMNGGKVIAMLDRVKAGNDLKSSVIELPNITDWLKVNKIIVKDKLLLDKVNAYAGFSSGYISYQVPYPYWVRVEKKGFAQENPVVSDLEFAVLPWISPIEIGADRPSDIEYTTLARSSRYNTDVGLDQSLLPEVAQREVNTVPVEPQPLVVLASGKLVSAFGANGKQPPVSGAEVKTVANDAQLMVIGGAQFIEDKFLRQFDVNSVLFENAADFMAMGNQLIGIRSKGVTDRPIEEISSGGMVLAKYLNILMAPMGLVAIGLIVLFLRRQKRIMLGSIYREPLKNSFISRSS